MTFWKGEVNNSEAIPVVVETVPPCKATVVLWLWTREKRGTRFWEHGRSSTRALRLLVAEACLTHATEAILEDAEKEEKIGSEAGDLRDPLRDGDTKLI